MINMINDVYIKEHNRLLNHNWSDNMTLKLMVHQYKHV